MDQYVVVGNPIAHSKSPAIHAHFAEQTRQDMQYDLLLGDLETFESQIQAFFAGGGKGCNVTVPFKERAYQLCSTLSKRAQIAGAVNTLLQNQNGDIYGDNTDGVGMVRDITVNHQQSIKNKSVLILGAGGAVRGVLEPIVAEQPQAIVIANRTVSKAETLANLVSSDVCSASSFTDLQGSFDIIINGTSASLSGELPPIPTTVVHTNTWCYDMMYAKDKTVFLQWADSLGAKGADGLGMLVEQAAESFTQWRSVRPKTDGLIKVLRSKL
ncbi:shikimate dehydrogenase [Marinomonas agarivorans]|nr:shikimate dehydrogenase [Marinomonas agarivorans]